MPLTQLRTFLGPFQLDIFRESPSPRYPPVPGVRADPSSSPGRWAYLTRSPALFPSSSLSALLNEACPSPHASPGLRAPAATWPPAQPGLTNFGLPARQAPSSAPPIGLPGPDPLLPSPVGHSNPRWGPDPPLLSGQAALLSRAPSPLPSGLHQPGTWGSVSPVGPKPVSNRQTAAAQPNPPAPPPRPRLGRGPRPIVRLPAYHQGWVLCAGIRQSWGERRVFIGAVTNDDEPETGQAGPQANMERESLKMDEIRSHWWESSPRQGTVHCWRAYRSTNKILTPSWPRLLTHKHLIRWVTEADQSETLTSTTKIRVLNGRRGGV